MNGDFQDRIDDYLLGRMSDEEKELFEKELSEDNDKREQFEFTRNVKRAISSRQEKLEALKEMKIAYDMKRQRYAADATGTDGMLYCPAPEPLKAKSANNKHFKKVLLWVSGVAAIFIIGLMVIMPNMTFTPNMTSAPDPGIRGQENDVFEYVTPDKVHSKKFGCSRKKSNKEIREIEEESIITDTIRLDTITTISLK